MTLFDSAEQDHLRRAQPLAARMRPRSLSEFIGQEHFLGSGQLLTRLIDADRIGSAIFYGPPGTGKTTLAMLLADATSRRFCQMSAISSGVKELRAELAAARDELAASGRGTLLFVDELHRFNKTQQDALLGDVEEGIVTLIGVTTSNPFFAVNNALISRSQIFQFQPLTVEQVLLLLHRALQDPQRGLGGVRIEARPEALQFIARTCDGDARRALSVLEVAVRSSREPVLLDLALARQATAQRAVQYDPTGDEHYDCASALIKSIRGSDVDAGIYWLARMLEGGEDIRFLCRRLVILASEDIGNAEPQALPLAVACFDACEKIGLPECQLTLAQTVAYLACAPKSNASTVAIGQARRDIQENTVLPVPRQLRDSSYQGARRLGHGEDYRYSHQEEDAVASQDYLGVDRQYYCPVPRGFEIELARRLEAIRRKLSVDPPQRHEP